MGLLNTICNYIDLHHDDAALKRSKKEFFQQQTLTTFLTGLKEPLGATIRAMRPPNLSSAIQYIHNTTTNQQVFGKPQNVWATRNNPNNPSTSQQPKPTPMSVSTRNTGPLTQNRRQFQNFQNFRSQPQQGPNFTSEELFNIEQYDQYNGKTSTSHENLGHFPENAPPEDYTKNH
ncbi:hypothetical protein JTB14_004733 [Gonioctena quinquepunctata]|nr:hypothetical protein JTB14_004733 [Gonioctena quinquepunctata]